MLQRTDTLNLNTGIRPSSRNTAPARKIARICPPAPARWVEEGVQVSSHFSCDGELPHTLRPLLWLDAYLASGSSANPSAPGRIEPPLGRDVDILTLVFSGGITRQDDAGKDVQIGPEDMRVARSTANDWQCTGHGQEATRGRMLQGVQLCIDVPQGGSGAASSQAITADEIPSIRLPNAAGRVRVLAGEYQRVRGPARTAIPIQLLDGRLMRRGRAEVIVPAERNAALLLIAGDLVINANAKAAQHQLVVFANEGERITLDAESNAHWLLFSAA